MRAFQVIAVVARAIVSTGIVALAAIAIILTRTEFSPGAAAGQLTPDQLKAGAADRLEAALATGGNGITFQVIQRNTLYARAGGPKIQLADPADQTRVLAEVDELFVNTVLSQGAVTADAFWMEMRGSRAADATFDKAGFFTRVQEVDGALWRDDGLGWYVTNDSPGVGMDPVTARLLPTLLRSLSNAQETSALQHDGRSLAGITGTSSKAVFPGVIAADGATFTEATLQVDAWFDADGRLVQLEAHARNLNQATYDLISETVITLGYGGAGSPPELKPMMGALTTSSWDGVAAPFAGGVGLLSLAAIWLVLRSRKGVTSRIVLVLAAASPFREPNSWATWEDRPFELYPDEDTLFDAPDDGTRDLRRGRRPRLQRRVPSELFCVEILR